MKKVIKPHRRYLIKDVDDHSEAYLKKLKKYEADDVGLLTLSGVSGKKPHLMNHSELLHSFECLKVLYCWREREYQEAMAELSKYKEAQKGRSGFLKDFGAKDLDPWVFIRLVVLRFNELPKSELEPLIKRKPNLNHYKVKHLSKSKFQKHLKIANDFVIWINYPSSRSRAYIHALKVMAIGVLEDYLGKDLSPLQRTRIIDETGERLKDLLKILNRMD